MRNQTTINDHLSIVAPAWWSREGIGGKQLKGIRINEGRGFAFITDDEILPLANALADHLAQRQEQQQ